MAVRVQLRRDTAANWTTANPILAAGEVGVETNTGLVKIGDGVTAWTSLAYHTAVALAPAIAGATSKATPVDADVLPLADSAASFGLKKLTWANLKATLKSYMDTLYQALTPSYTWATLPSAATAGARALAWVSDLGENGTLMQSNGTRWLVAHGRANLKVMGAPVSGIGLETIVAQALLPAGSWQVNDTIRFWLTANKSGTTNGLNLTVRIGTAGTTSDTAITGLSAFQMLSTSGRAGGAFFDIKLLSTTSAQKLGSNQINTQTYTVSGTTAGAAATTIPDASTNALYVSIGIATSGAPDTVGADSCDIQLLTP